MANFTTTSLGTTDLTVVFSNMNNHIVRSSVRTFNKHGEDPIVNCTGLIETEQTLADTALCVAVGKCLATASKSGVPSMNIVVKDSVAIRAYQVKKLIKAGYGPEDIAAACATQEWMQENAEEWNLAILSLAHAMIAYPNVGFTKFSNTYMWNFTDKEFETYVEEGQVLDFAEGKTYMQLGEEIVELQIDTILSDKGEVVTGPNGRKGIKRTGKQGILNVVKALHENNKKYLPTVVDADAITIQMSEAL